MGPKYLLNAHPSLVSQCLNFILAAFMLFPFAGEGQLEKTTRHRFGLKLSGHLPPDHIIQSKEFNTLMMFHLHGIINE